MAEEVKLGVEIDAEVNGSADAKQLADTVADISSALRDLVTAAKTAAAGLDRVEKGAAGVTKAATGAKQAVSAVADNITESALASQYARDHMASLGNEYYTTAKGATEYARRAAENMKIRDRDAALTRAQSDAQQELNTYLAKAQGYMSRDRIGFSGPQGGRDYRNASTTLDTLRAAEADESSRRNREIARSMQERAKIEDQVTAEVVANTKKREDALRAEFNQMLAIDAEIAQQQQNRRYAVPTPASRNVASPLAKAAAQDEYSKQELSAMRDFYTQQEKIASGAGDMRDALFTARFALHDVSNAFALTGGALVAFNALTVKTAADYEQAFAQIRRTTGATEADMVGIREQFIGLAQDIPVAFSELAKIGTLAGQLNIPTQNLEQFTKTTAMFASTTDVTVEAAATAFGRLDTLLPDVKGNYDALGSSILNVGINSVATESEIISTTNQIAAAGAQAGFTADEVIGLAASFASLGVAPESARGTTIRVLSEIRSAVLEGGEALDTFAKLSGQSADAFKQAWSQDAAGAFMSVLQGLNKEGSMAEVTLRSLGITAVRDIRALLALSQNVEVVGQNFGYAAQGFEDGTQLADSFAITSETLASRLQVLGQSLEALVATLGESGTGPLTDFVKGLNELVKWITELAKSPFAQWAFVAVGLFTALTGGALLVASALARMGAAAVAAKTITVELRAMNAAALAASGGVQTLQTRAIGAAKSLLTLGGALRSIAVTTAIGAGITALTIALDNIGEAMKSSADKAKDAFGDLSAVSDALQKDTEAVRLGAEAYGYVDGSIKRTASSTADWVAVVEQATGGQVRLSDATTTTTDQISTQTFAIGENTAAVIANNLANNKTAQDAITQFSALQTQMSKVGGPQLDTKGLLQTAIGDPEQAQQDLLAYEAALARTGNLTLEATNTFKAMGETIDLIGGQVQGAAAAIEITDAVNQAFGVNAVAAAEGISDEGDAAAVAADQMTALKSAVESAFAGQNAISAFAQDFYTLAEGIATGGASLNAFSQAGQENIANLQSSIVTAISAGQAMGLNATQSVAVLFQQLQQMGIDTAALLASLSGIGIPGVSLTGVSAYMTGTKQMTGAGAQLSNILGHISKNASSAAQSIGGGGGGVGGAAQEAAKEIRTLVDYANDLGSVMSRAFDIRFGGGQALDKITKGWNDIAKATKEANDAIKDSYVTLKQLTSDKAISEYFLGVANQYGDQLRAGAITADLAEINKKIADEQAKVASNQEKANKTLTGNSAAAIENRSTLLGLVSSYQELLEQYAASGMSQADLAKKSEELRQDFIKQATQMGFNRRDVEKYGLAFQDFTKIIKQVPRNITVSANIDPARQALNEFVAKTKSAMSQARGAVGGGVRIPMQFVPDYSGIRNQIQSEIDALRGQLLAAYALNNGNANGKTTAIQNAINQLRNSLAQFKSGGYTGSAGVNDVTGVVHGREYVINAANTDRLGLPFLNALNSGMTPATPGGGSGIMVVELSSYDRMLLAKAGDVQLSISGDKIAQVTNASNLVAAKRGTN